MNKSKVICIMGPTASGKTATALALAKQFPCEIISVDSALVYRGMDIGTAKPTAEEQAAVPHHLIDICDPSNSYSAGMFYQAAEKLIADILKRGRTPLLVGGTMLYFRAIQKGIAFLPAAEIAVRKNLETELLHQGLDHLYTRLKALDPGSAARIDGNDSQRILRALEVYEISGNV